MFGRVLRKVLGINFHRQTVLLLLYNVTYVYLLCALLFFCLVVIYRLFGLPAYKRLVTSGRRVFTRFLVLL
jgi:hypothetical protein